MLAVPFFRENELCSQASRKHDLKVAPKVLQLCLLPTMKNKRENTPRQVPHHFGSIPVICTTGTYTEPFIYTH